MHRLLAVTVCLLLSACSTFWANDGVRRAPGTVDAVSGAQPRGGAANRPYYEVAGRRYHVMPSAAGYVERGRASWYGSEFQGRPTSSGEPFDMNALTAAHRGLPLPTYAEVTNLANGRKVVVRVNDRGPFHDDRIIDLSRAAAEALGMLGQGIGEVEVRALASLDATAPDTEEGGRLYLQVGAYSERGNAERLLDRLTENAIAKAAVVGARDGAVFRVRIGPFTSRAEADPLLGRLAQLGVIGPYFIVD